ncbi:YkgJ family cysteine cluster protein [Elizabethkingia argentiflava]|uniref:YkgJ family cysteine cluster protein n=1 Tax=Elizabethkingia argenteiflava TaxID=2681556 RepID=A0A845PVY0_9FLAO|nr:YkgJ family cysteine cluster protein [Elizabethkingia argenteiflava]NAW50468.1 YkgJ family cysteine cluster protein [Elizabethkingia argenteiflava]
MDLKYYKTQAKLKKKENQKFLETLKKKPPKNLDYVAEEIHNEVFEQINCLECANCCKTTGPLFTEKDIERISKHLRLKPSEFEDKFLRVDEDQDKVLQSLPCAFLLQDNECAIYQVRPKACREYPHTNRKKIYQINVITLKNAEICPAVYLFMEKFKVNLEKK